MNISAAALAASLALSFCPLFAAQSDKTRTTFQVNDSLIKDKVLAGVSVAAAKAEGGGTVASGRTDENGRLALSLAPGDYTAAFKRSGYVAIERSPFTVGRTPKTITTTMSMLLEETGQARHRRVQIVLNWGSETAQVKDADSHLACPDEQGHVYYGRKNLRSDEFSATLDVDDMDWGGPETITLIDPPPGEYRYWVDKFSSAGALGASDVVVRIVFDDHAVGEHRIPPGLDSQTWRPFKAVAVGEDLAPRIVEFTPAELAAGKDRELPVEQSKHGDWGLAATILMVSLAVAFVIVAIAMVMIRQKGRRGR